MAGLGLLLGVVVLAFTQGRPTGMPDGSVPIGPTSAPSVAETDPYAARARELETQIQQRLGVVGTTTLLSHAVAVFGEGVGRLLASPGVEVTYTARGTDAGTITGEAVVAPALGSLDSRETITLDTATPMVERRVVGDTLYIRALADVSADEADWDAIPVDALVEMDTDRVFVAGGRLAGSLQRLADLMATVADPEALQRASEDAGEDLGEVQSLALDDRRYRLILPVRMIAAINLNEHLETAEYPVSHDDLSVFEFTVDTGGTLTALSAYGVLLQDAEPIGPVIVDVTYRTVTEPVVAPPPVEDVRG